MVNQFDYYEVLQVHFRAEKGVIDAAYRRLAAKYHPDVSHVSDAGDRMKQINAAYEVLSDPVTRAAYDASRCATPSSETPPHDTTRSRYPISARLALIAAGSVILAVVTLRLAPAFLLVVTKLLVPLAVIFSIVWLLFTLARPKR
ncbi:MAG: DnaJ domain-containing protein [Chloroflexi bacterium]|nr:DnaJ domain-containing protein [Chloroflexota bacterium]